MHINIFTAKIKIHIWCAPVYFMLSPRRIGLMRGDDWESVYLHFMMGTLEYKWDSLPWFDLNVTISTCLASLAPFKLPSGTASYTYLHKQKKKSWKPQNPTNISQQLSEDKNDEQLRGNLKGEKTKLRWNPVPCDPLAIHFLLGAALSLRTTWRVQSKHGTLKDLLSP